MDKREILQSMAGKGWTGCVLVLVDCLMELAKRVEEMKMSTEQKFSEPMMFGEGVEEGEGIIIPLDEEEEKEVEAKAPAEKEKRTRKTPPVPPKTRTPPIFPLPEVPPLPPPDSIAQPDQLVLAKGTELVCAFCHQPSVRVESDIYGSTQIDMRENFSPLIGGWGEEIQVTLQGGMSIQCPACGAVEIRVISRGN